MAVILLVVDLAASWGRLTCLLLFLLAVIVGGFIVLAVTWPWRR